jgi:hypothetical protein
MLTCERNRGRSNPPAGSDDCCRLAATGAMAAICANTSVSFGPIAAVYAHVYLGNVCVDERSAEEGGRLRPGCCAKHLERGRREGESQRKNGRASRRRRSVRRVAGFDSDRAATVAAGGGRDGPRQTFGRRPAKSSDAPKKPARLSGPRTEEALYNRPQLPRVFDRHCSFRSHIGTNAKSQRAELPQHLSTYPTEPSRARTAANRRTHGSRGRSSAGLVHVQMCGSAGGFSHSRRDMLFTCNSRHVLS